MGTDPRTTCPPTGSSILNRNCGSTTLPSRRSLTMQSTCTSKHSIKLFNALTTNNLKKKQLFFFQNFPPYPKTTGANNHKKSLLPLFFFNSTIPTPIVGVAGFQTNLVLQLLVGVGRSFLLSTVAVRRSSCLPVFAASLACYALLTASRPRCSTCPARTAAGKTVCQTPMAYAISPAK